MKNYFIHVYIAFSVLTTKHFLLGCKFDGKNFLYNCSGNSLKYVPFPVAQARKAEILDLSENYFRELLNDSFKWFSKVRVLKLNQNKIFSIEPNAFSYLTKLTTLDLTQNSFRKIPCNLPPSLLHLNLNDNPITDEDDCLHCISPLTSLETFSLKQSRLHKFPRFCESAPSIVELDISKSSIDSINEEDVALLCGLKRLTISSGQISQHSDVCRSLQFEKWLADHDIETTGNIQPINYNTSSNCSLSPTNNAIEVYRQCKFKQFFQKYLWALIGGCVLLVTCVLIVVLWCRKRRRGKKMNFENSSIVSYKNRLSDDKNDAS